MSNNSMTVQEFCLHHTNALEFCAIRIDGYVIATVWIDHEDLFRIAPDIAQRKVKSNEWGVLTITDKNNSQSDIPCHYINT